MTNKDEMPGNLPELLDYIESHVDSIRVSEKFGRNSRTFRTATLSNLAGDRAIHHAFRLIRAKLLPGGAIPFAQPATTMWDKCMDCGATLRGSWTQHTPGCTIGALITELNEDPGI